MHNSNSVQEPRRHKVGRPRGRQDLVCVAFNMPLPLRQRIDALALRERRTLTQQLLFLIDRGLESREASEARQHA